MQCKMNLFHISVANLGFLHDMRMARWIKTNQALGPNLVTKLPVILRLTSAML